MRFYIVGGYVRDRALGREAKDHDFVVTGATADDMIAAGYVPIEAQAFPVFHHPVSRDEYALARTERKTGEGYHGFEAYSDPAITIEEDLVRRDITINAMAREVLSWNDEGHAKLSDEIIDPYGGMNDLRAGVIRHVSDAFAEDPLRVLRVARFAARYNFKIAPETMELMRELTRSGELDYLTAERVWLELEKAVMEEQPSRFFWVLEQCGAREVLFPQLERSLIHSGYSLFRATLRNADRLTRFMLLFSSISEPDAVEMLEELKAPAEVSRLVRRFLVVQDLLLRFGENDAEQFLETLIVLDAFRQPDDIFRISAAIEFVNDPGIARRMDKLLTIFRETRKVTFATLTDKEQKLEGSEIAVAIYNSRLKKAKEVM